jgi:hypothetical protein
VARDRSEVVVAVVNVCALAGALISLAAGAPVQRLRPVAVFCGIGATAAIYLEAARALARRRARAQSAAPLPRDVALRKPLWISSIDGASIMMFATPLGALAGAAGFSSVGAGISLTVVALVAVGFVLGGVFEPRALTFERDGLRVQIRGATFLVRWDSIADVTSGGKERRLVSLRITGPRAVLASVEPDTSVPARGRGSPSEPDANRPARSPSRPGRRASTAPSSRVPSAPRVVATLTASIERGGGLRPRLNRRWSRRGPSRRRAQSPKRASSRRHR